MSFRQHTLMQDTGDENAAALLPLKNDVLAMLVAAQAGANLVVELA
jgi:hypothetical protein